MALNWIKFETTTSDKPEVWAIANELGIDPDAVVGKLLRVWAWFDEQTENGNAPSVTSALLDRRVGVTGFVKSVIQTGWLEDDGEYIRIVNFDRHNGETAKTRALTAKRVAKHKSITEEKRKGNAGIVTLAVTSALPRIDKNRVLDKSVPLIEIEPSSSMDLRAQEKEILDFWNNSEAEPKVRKLSPDRLKKLRARLKDCDWPWREAIERLPIPNSERFEWQPDFDWLIANDKNAYALAEGKYSKPTNGGVKRLKSITELMEGA